MSDVLAGAGVLVAAGAAAAAILLPPGRGRAAAMLLALALFPTLILADQWNSAEVMDLRDHAGRLAVLALAALAGAAALAWGLHRLPRALPLAIVFALPFRVPLEAGGETANLLVPLYLVIAAGVLATAFRDLSRQPAGLSGREAETQHEGEGGGPRAGAASCFSHRPLGERNPAQGEKPSARSGPPAPAPQTPTPGATSLLPPILAAFALLYALQALYSPDFSESLQAVCFFFVPFSLMFALLRGVEWDRKLLVAVLALVAAEAIVFVLIGSVEYLTGSLIWNEQVIRSNEFHTYFRVNSLFWDPNVYGRYLALAIAIAMAALLWAGERRALALLSGLVAVMWLGLVPTFSQSSFAALLAGLAVLAALRWSARWTLATAAALAVGGLLVVGLAGDSEVDFSRLNIDTGGRANLVSGGADLFAERPLWGHGSGSFPTAYKENVADPDAPVSESHTEPVTVAAEQGLIGLLAYATLLAVALWALAAGTRNALSPVPSPRAEATDEEAQTQHAPNDHSTTLAVGRAAVLAAFAALLIHSAAYAGFFEDPIAWVLLAVGTSLAGSQVRDAP